MTKEKVKPDYSNRSLMPYLSEGPKQYRLTKDTFGGKKGDIVLLYDEPIDGSYEMINLSEIRRGTDKLDATTQPFVDFDAVEPHGWEIRTSPCPEGYVYVRGHLINHSNKYGHNITDSYCRKLPRRK